MAKTNLYIGLMSGTSLDGIDVVLVDFESTIPKLISSFSFPLPKLLKLQIQQTIKPSWLGSLKTIGDIHTKLGALFADAVNEFLQSETLDINSIVAIGSHGQTLWHQPVSDYPFSMQLGDANIIAEKTGITTIADFRNRDIAAGGQGAPLVPAFHREYLSSPSVKRVILNIGGIANITRLPPINSDDESVIGFDTGPGNGLIDAWNLKHQSTSYDENGDWGKSGRIIPDLLEKLLSDPYFSQAIPKSTGKEYFNLDWLENCLNGEIRMYAPEDIQAILTELTAISISQQVVPDEELYICGGGLSNLFLLERIKHHIPENKVASTAELGIHPDWMEAMAFAWLAKQTLEGKSGNLPSVTGAKGSRILGAIYQA